MMSEQHVTASHSIPASLMWLNTSIAAIHTHTCTDAQTRAPFLKPNRRQGTSRESAGMSHARPCLAHSRALAHRALVWSITCLALYESQWWCERASQWSCVHVSSPSDHCLPLDSAEMSAEYVIASLGRPASSMALKIARAFSH